MKKNKERKRTDLEEDHMSSKRRPTIAAAENSRNTSSKKVANPQKSSHRFTEKQKQGLMIAYHKNDYLDAASRLKLAEKLGTTEKSVNNWFIRTRSKARHSMFPQSSGKSGKSNTKQKKRDKTPRDLPLLCECNDMKKDPLKEEQVDVLTQRSDTPSVITESPEKDGSVVMYPSHLPCPDTRDKAYLNRIFEEMKALDNGEQVQVENGSASGAAVDFHKQGNAGKVCQENSAPTALANGSEITNHKVSGSSASQCDMHFQDGIMEEERKESESGSGPLHVLTMEKHDDAIAAKRFVTKASVKMCYRKKKNGKMEYFNPEASPTAEKTFKYNAGLRPVKDSKKKGLKAAIFTDMGKTEQRMKKLEVHRKKNPNPSRAEISTMTDRPKTRKKSGLYYWNY